MARVWRRIALALLIAVIAVLIYRVYPKHRHDSVSEHLHRDPILLPGIQEPQEMRVEPFPAYVPTEPERMVGQAMKETQGSSSPDALLPALNRILSKYPDYADGHVLRLGSLCNGKDRAAILSDVNSALKYEGSSDSAKEMHASMLSMKAKVEHDDGDDAAAMQDLDSSLHANLADATRFTNSGAIAPEKSTSACTWSETDVDGLTKRFPSDYRSYLYAGLYYGFFTTWNEDSLKPALRSLDKASEMNPNSALPHFFSAHVLRQATFLKSMNMSDAQRADLSQQLLSELNKALVLDPNLLPALSDRTDVYFNLKQFQQAISDHDKILVLDPQDAGAYNDRGLAKIELGDTYGAISDFSEAIQHKNRALQQTSSYENRADAYVKTQQWNLAIRDLTTAISLQTGGVSLLMNINQFRALYPEYKQASDEAVARKLNQTFFPNLKYEDFAKGFLHDNVERGFFGSTTIPDLYIKRSDAYIGVGDWHNAAVDFRRAVNGFPSYANAIDRWRKIDSYHNTPISLDLQTFDDSLSGSMKLWTKQSDASADASGPYTLSQYEFNCGQRQLRRLSFARYSASGNLLASRTDDQWESSIPDTLGETLIDHICKTSRATAN
jgi:tetratricopeptide (TPR) repeat protein